MVVSWYYLGFHCEVLRSVPASDIRYPISDAIRSCRSRLPIGNLLRNMDLLLYEAPSTDSVVIRVFFSFERM